MNKVILIGRLTRDPEVRVGASETKIARYSLAVDRKGKEGGADFISCVVFGKGADFAENFLRKGIKIAIEGRIQTGSYEKDGRTVYTTDIVVDSQEFVEPKAKAMDESAVDGFVAVEENPLEELPFN